METPITLEEMHAARVLLTFTGIPMIFRSSIPPSMKQVRRAVLSDIEFLNLVSEAGIPQVAVVVRHSTRIQ